MKAKLKAVVKGAILGLGLVAIAVAASSCESMPPVTVIGNYGTYSYSSKEGIKVIPRLSKIIIHADK